jgi:integrase/recombinase XerD
VTELRQRVLEELQRRNFSPHTIRGYIRTIRDFAAYFHKSPDQLGVEEVRQFQLHMLRDQKLATGTVQNRMTALHFFFKRVLKRHDPELYDMALTRRPKKLPVVLSPEEVEKLIDAAPNIRYRMILVLLYSTGLRRTEASQLKIADIDSKRMVIHVHEGKNSRDRELPLTPKLLAELRDYWRACKVKPRVYLFPTRFKSADEEERPITDKAVWHACRESARRSGLSKRFGPHTLRHTFATHLLESGTDLPTIQLLMGHQKLQDTTLYLHLSRRHLHAAVNPLERITIRGVQEKPAAPESSSRGAAEV